VASEAGPMLRRTEELSHNLPVSAVLSMPQKKRKENAAERKSIDIINAYYTLIKKTRVQWGSIYEAGSLLNSKEPFMLKKGSNDKKEPFWHKGSL